MPYAQCHYPFAGEKSFEFPADFVAEGIDQTRGWFYTLLVLSTALFDKCPFKNVMVTGLILAENGEKMSKRLKNYPNPMDVVRNYGADALRLYLISSPAVKAECLKFREDGVREVQRDIFIPWVNALRFLSLNIERFEKIENQKFSYNPSSIRETKNPIDCWILSFLNTNIKFIHKEMTDYHLHTVCPCLLQFNEDLRNWYIRLNRPTLRGEQCSLEACQTSLSVLYHVLMSLSHLMAPFTPFLAEYFYQKLKPYDQKRLWMESDKSVHFRQMPISDSSLIDKEIECSMEAMRSVIETARTLRDKHKLSFKQALNQLVVICDDVSLLNYAKSMRSFIISEINVRSVVFTSDRKAYNVNIRVNPDFKKLGPKVKGSMKQLSDRIRSMKDQEYIDLLQSGYMEFPDVPGVRITPDDVSVSYSIDSEGTPAGNPTNAQLVAECSSDLKFICVLDVKLSDDLVSEKLAKELCNRIQRMRKLAKLVQTDNIHIYVKSLSASELESSIEEQLELIKSIVKQPISFHPSSNRPSPPFEILFFNNF